MGYTRNPILRKLDTIECRDALMNADGSEAEWPAADCIVGNPPFLGDKKMLAELGEEYTGRLRQLYAGRVPGGADLVTYWFEKARTVISTGQSQRAGLVSTNSIRGGANRTVLERIRESGRIFCARSDEPWINDGAAVRVSLVCFDTGGDSAQTVLLDGKPVAEIYPDLTARIKGAVELDLTTARPLQENASLCFQGYKFVGSFDMMPELARHWLQQPSNPNCRLNSDVIRRWVTGVDLTQRMKERWVIDFGCTMSEEDASLYELPFEYIAKHVKEERQKVRRDGHRRYWWRYGETRPAMRSCIANYSRFIVTPEVAKHRVFVWLDSSVLNSGSIYAIARDDDTTFGILHSRFHELWALRMCTFLGVGNDPRYTPTTTFETFPFPSELTPNIQAVNYADNPRAIDIADAARRLVELRDAWLNPPELVKRIPEVVTGYPCRILPVDEKAAKELAKRTLTNLYNQRPAWLDNAHRALDVAVAAAYGWEADISDDEILRRLLELNHARAVKR